MSQQLKIYVGNLNFSTSNQSFSDHFAQFGEVDDARIINDRETGRSRGFGFVTYKTEEDAQKALAADNTEFEGKVLRVNLAREEERRGGGGGRSGGGFRPRYQH